MRYLTASLRSSDEEDVRTALPVQLVRVEIEMTREELHYMWDIGRMVAYAAIVSPDVEMPPGPGPLTRFFYVSAVDLPTDEAGRNAYVEERAATVFDLVQGAYESCVRR